MKFILLRDARRKRNWTQEQLAAESGVDQTTISRLETDPDPNPTDITKERLAKALGIAPSRLRFAERSPRRIGTRASDRTGHVDEVLR
jgi:transcriptional regulator with XRE-family HTH domain